MCRENDGPAASLYLMTYLYIRCNLYTQYGIRKHGVVFGIGDSTLIVDTDGLIAIKGKEYRATTGLWGVLTHKNVV